MTEKLSKIELEIRNAFKSLLLMIKIPSKQFEHQSHCIRKCRPIRLMMNYNQFLSLLIHNPNHHALPFIDLDRNIIDTIKHTNSESGFSLALRTCLS